MRAFDPKQAVKGTVLSGIDPSTLLSNRDELEQSRIDRQRDLIRRGIPRQTMIQVNLDGVIIQGNHGARAAAEVGVAIDVEVIDLPHPHWGPILGIAVVRR
jgi:hypothetical protein